MTTGVRMQRPASRIGATATPRSAPSSKADLSLMPALSISLTTTFVGGRKLLLQYTVDVLLHDTAALAVVLRRFRSLI